MALVAATLLGIIILGEQTAPPDLTEFEQEIAASQTIDTTAGGRVARLHGQDLGERAAERRHAGDDLVQSRAERVEVGPAVRALSPEDLRGHVHRRPL